MKRAIGALVLAAFTIGCGVQKGDSFEDPLTGEKLTVLSVGKASDLIDGHRKAAESIDTMDVDVSGTCAEMIVTIEDTTREAIKYHQRSNGKCFTVISSVEMAK